MKSKKLVPNWRFPEFKNDGEWEEKKLSNIYTFKVTNSFPRDNLNYTTGLVKNIHYGDIHTKFSILFDIEKENVPFINSSISLEKIKEENYCQESDIVFADASEDLNDIGKSIELVSLNNEKLLAGLHTLLARQKENKFITGFGGYLFKSTRIRDQIKRESQGAKVLGISGTRLSNINICFPENKQEQQRIVDSLILIDELISFQNKKLGVLTDHKKALIQNLFPIEGKNVPKWRFPEFENDGKWDDKILDDVIDYENGKAHENDILDKGNYIVVNSKFIATEGQNIKYTNSAFCLASKNDILMVLSDVPNGRAIAKCYFVEDENLYTVNQRICKLKAKNGINKFYFYILNRNKYFLSFDDGVKQTNLRKDDVLNCPLLIPSNEVEQQKIADCISSIDNLITTQTDKIEALQKHKKTLMQNLFPSEEI